MFIYKIHEILVIDPETRVATTLNSMTVPATVTLTSTHLNRGIEISTDEGVIYHPASIDIETPEQLVLTINNPITHLKFIGDHDDPITIIST